LERRRDLQPNVRKKKKETHGIEGPTRPHIDYMLMIQEITSAIEIYSTNMEK
jgi:hypothetical protein